MSGAMIGPAVGYRVFPADPADHLYEVTVTVADPDPSGQILSLPAWIPGSYMIRDFAKNVVDLSARCGDSVVVVGQLDKASWRCESCRGPLSVRCRVYAWDLSVRAAHLDTTHGYFNGTSVFLRVHGKEQRCCEVDIAAPEGESYLSWRVATSMPSAGAAPWSFGRYQAEDYQALIDHPVEMGNFALTTFEAGGLPHEAVVTGRQRADLARLGADIKAVCEEHQRLFGGPPPIDRYVFLIMAVGEGYGGLEHRSSCSLLCSRDSLPRPGEPEVSDEYRGLLGLASHEYFHAWNVKRIKPAAFVPYDLTREVYTELLWAFEGITSYYDDLALVRSGRIDAQSYLELLGQTITRLLRGSGRFKQTLAQSSWEAWTKFYRQDENAPNAIVSYYTKGALVALALDITLRWQTDGRCCLDDVMRALWERHGRSGVGVPEDGVERVAAEVSGLDLGTFFETAIRSTEDLPLGDLLGQMGVDLSLRPAESQDDKGGKPARTPEEQLRRRATLGIRLAEEGAEARVANVFDGSPAQQAGMASGDIVIALDGLRVTRGTLEKRIATYPVGSQLTLHVFRRDELTELTVTLQAAPRDTCFLTLRQDVDDAMREARQSWLGPQ